jgi:ribosomal protein L37AE/L43A
MGNEKLYQCHCPQCGAEKLSRKRDMFSVCKQCNMRNIEKQYRHLKVKENKLSVAEYSKRTREKYKNDKVFRLKCLLGSAKARAKNKGLEFSLTINDLLDLFPEDGLCPVLGIKMSFNSSGKGNRFNSPSLDRFDNEKGYTKENVCVISARANILKSDATLEEIEAVYLYMKS